MTYWENPGVAELGLDFDTLHLADADGDGNAELYFRWRGRCVAQPRSPCTIHARAAWHGSGGNRPTTGAAIPPAIGSNHVVAAYRWGVGDRHLLIVEEPHGEVRTIRYFTRTRAQWTPPILRLQRVGEQRRDEPSGEEP